VAVTEKTAMEAEVLVAAALRAKAILPLCVGVSVTAASFALIAPSLLELWCDAAGHGVDGGPPALDEVTVTGYYLAFPLVAVLGAAVSALAFQDVAFLCASVRRSAQRRRWGGGLRAKRRLWGMCVWSRSLRLAAS
jgi:hypothetical protein